MSVKKVVAITLLAQLMIEAIDEIEDEHKEIFRHGFKQKGKAFCDECVKMVHKITAPMGDEKQMELILLSEEIKQEMKYMYDQIS